MKAVRISKMQYINIYDALKNVTGSHVSQDMKTKNLRKKNRKVMSIKIQRESLKSFL